MRDPTEALLDGCAYAIDEDDVLTFVGNAWSEFARRNDAPELAGDAVVGHSLWEYVSGDETRDVYRLLFSWVREHGASIKIPFRCDSPRLLRNMQLEICPRAGSIELRSELLEAHAHPAMALLAAVGTHSAHRLLMCSFCKRIFAAGQWLDAFDALTRLDLVDAPRPPCVDYRVCDRCRSQCARSHLATAERHA